MKHREIGYDVVFTYKGVKYRNGKVTDVYCDSVNRKFYSVDWENRQFFNIPEWAVVITKPFSEKQLRFLTEHNFTKVSNTEYHKQYGPDYGSHIWIYSSPKLNIFKRTSQMVVDRNLFITGHEECWQDIDAIERSGLFSLGGKR